MYDRDQVRRALMAFPEPQSCGLRVLGAIDALYSNTKATYRLEPLTRSRSDVSRTLTRVFQTRISDFVAYSASRSLRGRSKKKDRMVPIPVALRSVESLILEWEKSRLDERLKHAGALNAFQGVHFHSEVFWVESRYALTPGNFTVIPVAIAMLLKYTILGDVSGIERMGELVELLRYAVPLGPKQGSKRMWLLLTA